MDGPAPIDELREHLRSRDPLVRRAAAVHAQAHGANARSLAADVARLLDDDDEGVQYCATRAFREIGKGAIDAVPILIAHLVRESAPPMLQTRATFLLAVIGDEARDAIPILFARAQGEDRGDAIEALIGVAPPERHDEIARLVIAALFDEDYGIRSGVARALSKGPRWLQEAALDAAEARAGSIDAMAIVNELAPRHPQRAIAMARHAILAHREDAGLAMLALERTGLPVDEDVGRAMIEAVANDDRTARSIEALRKRLPDLRDPARSHLIPEIQGNLRKVAGVAKALAILAPRSEEVVPALIDRLNAGLMESKPEWYPLGDIAEAIGALSGDATHARATSTLDDVLARSRSFIRKDESAVLDFQRRVKRGLAALDEAPSQRVEADVVDEEHDAMDAIEYELPPIPKTRAPRARTRTPNKKERAELDRAREEGEALLDAHAIGDVRDDIAAFVDEEVRAMRREGRTGPVPPLAAIYGDALAGELGWEWKLWTCGPQRALAVVAPDGTHAVLPGRLITSKLGPGADVTLLLLFRMLAARDLPKARPNALVLLG